MGLVQNFNIVRATKAVLWTGPGVQGTCVDPNFVPSSSAAYISQGNYAGCSRSRLSGPGRNAASCWNAHVCIMFEMVSRPLLTRDFLVMDW